MPMLDVSDVLTDPMFCEELSVTRRVEVIDEANGISSTSDVLLKDVFGVVTIGSVNPLVRTEEYEFARNNITVHTQTQLRDKVSGNKPDVITWDGSRYLVKKCFPWNKYGDGFYAADCELMTPARADDSVPDDDE